MDYRVTSATAEQTREWGKRLGGCLRGGDVVALIGELGAGKTAFAQGVGEAFGVKGPMTSPTFTLIHEYIGRIKETEVRLIHMDLYRLQTSGRGGSDWSGGRVPGRGCLSHRMA